MIKIATHDGFAHIDEVMAIAAIVHFENLDINNIEILRTRDESLLSTADFVVDVGGIHDPSKKLFDHHQGGKDVEGKSSFGLVIEHYCPKMSKSMLVQRIDFQDNFGVAKAVEQFGGPTAIANSWFAFQFTNVNVFSKGNHKLAIEFAIEVIKEDLEEVTASESAKELFESLKPNLLKNGILDISNVIFESDAIQRKFNLILKKFGKEIDVTISCSKGNGEGMINFFSADLNKLCFNNISFANVEGITFIHATGFLLACREDSKLDVIKALNL